MSLLSNLMNGKGLGLAGSEVTNSDGGYPRRSSVGAIIIALARIMNHEDVLRLPKKLV
jgi:hypothetical protein